MGFQSLSEILTSMFSNDILNTNGVFFKEGNPYSFKFQHQGVSNSSTFFEPDALYSNSSRAMFGGSF